MKKRLLSLLFATALCYGAWAVPAKPVRKTVTLPDGTQAVATLCGDEHLSFYRTADGRRGTLDGAGRLRMFSDDEFEGLCRRAGAVRSQADARRAARLAPSPATGHRNTATKGRRRGLVVLVAFSDLDFTVADPNAAYRRFFNEEGYTEGGMAGSVHDYFHDQSYGQLDLTFDVYGPVTLNRSYTYYGRNSDEHNDVNVRSMVSESLRQLDEEIDYTRYDWDGDGEVEQVFFIYAGYGEAQGAPAETIWPHESTIASMNLTLDGVRLGTYGCSCELRGSKGNRMDGIGTACHEFTHCLGIKDMYDVKYNGGYGMASWDLMSGGSYNGNSCIPAGYTAYERWVSGWLEPTELKGDVTRVAAMQPVSDVPEAYILYNEREPNEYYMLENRQLRGWDAALPGHGLLVVHVDYDEEAWRGNTINAMTTHQRMTIVPADNTAVESDAAMAGDPYPGTTGNHALTNYTTPAATLFNRNTDRSLFLNKPIENIQEAEDGTVSFVALHPELQTPDPQAERTDATAFAIRWEPVDMATHYVVRLTETPRSRHDLAECLIMEEDFARCVTQTTGFTDISGKLDSYLANRGWSGSKLYTSPQGLRLGTSSEAGYFRTTGFHVPESGEVTLVLDVAPFAEGTTVEGEVRFVYNGRWDTYTAVPLKVERSGRLLLRCTGLTGTGAIDVRPASRMYITYMALYEGLWEDDELSPTPKAAPLAAPRRIATQTLTTDGPVCYVADANPTSTYTFSVRALTDEGVASQWSEERSFSLDDTAIIFPTAPDGGGSVSVPDTWFNLSGQRAAASMRPGVYLRRGRKTLLR